MFISSTVVGFATVGVAGLLGIWAYLGLRHRTRLGSSGSRLVTTVEGDSSQTTQLLDSGSSEPITKESVRRYAHPKIGLIDLHPEVTKALAEAGYAVDEGSFGRPYKVISQGTGLFQVVQNGKLPGLPEKEVLVVDLEAGEPVPLLPAPECPNEPGWWTKPDSGMIDPRPLRWAL